MDWKKMIDLGRQLFPKPNVPQKRYLALAVMVVYAGLKLYAWYTPTPDDDGWADNFQNVAQAVMVADSGEDGDGIAYGERG